MTNTMHRQGTVESLRQDYIIFSATAAGFNRKGAEKAQERFVDIMMRHGPVNLGVNYAAAEMEKKPNYIWEAIRERFNGRRYHNGQPTDETRRRWERALRSQAGDSSLHTHAVFDSVDKLAAAVRDVREADLGLCVDVNAVHEDTDQVARAAGIVRHSIEHSLGFHGQVRRLPSAEVLEISTMCGHGMVSYNLARKMISLVGTEQMSTDRAAELLAKPCTCGVFNPTRAARILGDIRSGDYFANIR